MTRRLKQVIITRICLDFYEDDMLPWVMSSIHIQRLFTVQVEGNPFYSPQLVESLLFALCQDPDCSRLRLSTLCTGVKINYYYSWNRRSHSLPLL
jgi:hypothetical protein